MGEASYIWIVNDIFLNNNERNWNDNSLLLYARFNSVNLFHVVFIQTNGLNSVAHDCAKQ